MLALAYSANAGLLPYGAYAPAPYAYASYAHAPAISLSQGIFRFSIFFLLIFNNPNILYCKGLPLAYAYAPQASIAVHAAAHPAIAYAAHPAAVSVHAAPAVVHAPAVVAAAPA